ncbi:MAG: glycogen synthase GlgA [Alphaproteobacteria bacterium]|nr:glycogen synthase GlgA [Alphaproteobacteria bacterium]
MTPIRCLAVTSEIYPIIKTGGLADVAGAMPIALKAHDVDTRSLVPGYPDVIKTLASASVVLRLPDFFGGSVRILAGTCGDLEVLAVDAPHLFYRHGNPYTAPDGRDWPDNGMRFAALSLIAARIGQGAIPSFVPDIIHAHDWQAGLTPAYLHYTNQPRPGTVLTIHNMAYQGQFAAEMLSAFNLPPESFSIHGVEYYGAIGFLKAGVQFADRITTVSSTYAKEIQSDEGGMGLAGLLRERSGVLSGIINGIDTTVWSPETDPHIACGYNATNLTFRTVNKPALQRRFNLDPDPDAMLLGVISRLSWQKGLDLLLECIPTILDQGIQLALLGTGDANLQERFLAAAHAHPGRISAVIGYDEGLAHLIQAGSDALVVPSRFEPCGLTQLCALRYGSIPIVARVGGLEDTVVDIDDAGDDEGVGTGVKFAPGFSDHLAAALRRTNQAFQDKSQWRRLQLNGMSTNVSWDRRAGEYAALYRDILAARQQ